MTQGKLILVHGLFAAPGAGEPDGAAREKAVAQYGESLGVCDYEWVSGRGKRMANRMLRRARGTAQAVDALEILEIDEASFRASLVDESGRAGWHKMLSCEPYGLDAARSFLLVGAPRRLIEGPGSGQRILWFGRGLNELSEADFISHYTGRHGPLVAGYAQLLGLRRYRQVPSEQNALCGELRELGLGQARAPGVFAELVMGRPPLNFSSLRARRRANREIAADEKRHIDFSRSMLLLA